jgi:hypothetical protein
MTVGSGGIYCAGTWVNEGLPSNQHAWVSKVSFDGQIETLLESGSALDYGGINSDANAMYVAWQESLLKFPHTGGPPVTLVAGVAVGPLAVDGKSVYWLAGEEVMKVGVDGGTPVTLVSAQKGARAIAVDASAVYWLSDDSTIKKCGLGGGTATPLAKGWGSTSWPERLVVGGQSIFWNAEGKLLKVAK